MNRETKGKVPSKQFKEATQASKRQIQTKSNNRSNTQRTISEPYPKQIKAQRNNLTDNQIAESGKRNLEIPKTDGNVKLRPETVTSGKANRVRTEEKREKGEWQMLSFFHPESKEKANLRLEAFCCKWSEAKEDGKLRKIKYFD
ncbi:hypothetical protein HPP92_028526 [Vanilla planifolia]|uniref:Uncharacterized protein n=1 Tax=Vanilla planifolia TaxID=51239 RepID=A0A835P520_VANPL|nr:hypothetical protein HPP92_028526 [Vanilla planifolia]